MGMGGNSMPGMYPQPFGMPLQMPVMHAHGFQQGMWPPSPNSLYPSPSPQSPRPSPNIMPSPRAVPSPRPTASPVRGARATKAAGTQSPPQNPRGHRHMQGKEAMTGRGHQGIVDQVKHGAATESQTFQASASEFSDGLPSYASTRGTTRLHSANVPRLPEELPKFSNDSKGYAEKSRETQVTDTSGGMLNRNQLQSFNAMVHKNVSPIKSRANLSGVTADQKYEQNRSSPASKMVGLSVPFRELPLSAKQGSAGRPSSTPGPNPSMPQYQLEQRCATPATCVASPRLPELLKVPFVPFSFILVRQHAIWALA